MSYWRKSLRESISTNNNHYRSRESLEYYSQFISFDQLEPQFRYLFELKRFPPEKSHKSKPTDISIPQSQLSSILTTLVVSKENNKSGTMERIDEEDLLLKPSPFWKIKRKPTQKSTSSSISKPENNNPNLGLFGDSKFSITKIGSPHEIWMLMAVLSKRVDTVVGVFRKPAAAKNVRILKNWLNQSYQSRNHNNSSESGNHSGSDSSGGGHKSELIERLQTSSVHSLACTLKEYLRSQDSPLLSHYEDWLKNDESEENLSKIQFIINQKLSDSRRKLLAAIVSILTKVIEARDTTAMTANSCAISLTPSLIWHEGMDASIDAKNVATFIQIVEEIIIHSKTIFSEKDLGRLGEILRREEMRKDSRRGSSSDDEISSNCESERSKNSHKSSGGDSGLSKTNSAETVPRKSLLNDRTSSDSVCKQSSKCSSVDSLDLLEKTGNLTNSSIFTDEGVMSMTPSRTTSNSTTTIPKYHQKSSNKFTTNTIHPIQTPSHLIHLEMEESFV